MTLSDDAIRLIWKLVANGTVHHADCVPHGAGGCVDSCVRRESMELKEIMVDYEREAFKEKKT